MPGLTLDSIDRDLAEWTSRVESAARDLLELQNLPSYELLAGGPRNSPRPHLSGLTAQSLSPALAAADAFLMDFSTLSDAVNQAQGMRAAITRKDRPSGFESKVMAVKRMLTDAVVRDRGGSMLSVEQLHRRMVRDFQSAFGALSQIDRTWKELDEKLAAVGRFLDEHGAENSAERLRTEVNGLRARVITDPLGANEEFDRVLAPLFKGIKEAVETLVRQRSQVRQNLQHGRELLAQLAEVRHETELLHGECKAKITGHPLPTPALPTDRVHALADWLLRLEAKLAEGYTDPVCVGLAHWTDQVNDLLAVEQRACHENRAPLELRRELRGRLSALEAKATVRGFGGDKQLKEAARRAAELLHARPTPLRDAQQLISAIEKRLSGI